MVRCYSNCGYIHRYRFHPIITSHKDIDSCVLALAKHQLDAEYQDGKQYNDQRWNSGYSERETWSDLLALDLNKQFESNQYHEPGWCDGVPWVHPGAYLDQRQAATPSSGTITTFFTSTTPIMSSILSLSLQVSPYSSISCKICGFSFRPRHEHRYINRLRTLATSHQNAAFFCIGDQDCPT